MQVNKTSVILPFKDTLKELDKILNALSKQTEKPNEVIIINASIFEINKIVAKYINFFQIIEKTFYNYDNKINAYPGLNRNLGIKYSNYDLIYFIDTKTIPSITWIENSKKLLIESKSDIVFGSTMYKSNSYFTDLILDLSYGTILYETVPGSIIYKKKFSSVGPFLNIIRAGEDLEWKKRVKNKIKYIKNNKEKLVYSNIKSNIFKIIKMYFIYAFHNSNIILIKNFKYRIQKISFLFFIIILSYFLINLITSLNFNSIIIYFLFVIILSYIFFRGFIYPLIVRKVKIKKLIYFRWVILGFIGLTLDISKYLGFISGILINLIKQSLNISYNLK